MLSYLSLAVGLLLPWYLGYQLLRKVTATSASRTGLLALCVGYGFFLGYAITAALLFLGARIFGAFSFVGILALQGGLALWLIRSQRSTAPGIRKAEGENAKQGNWRNPLAALLLLAIATQITLIAVEIVFRPVFPWDAWLNWTYRAKVWFFSDTLLPFSEPGTWVQGERLTAYNVDGAHYPPLVPLLTLWSALALGQWTETLINLPYLLAAISLVIAVYGQCRSSALSVRASLLCAYALLSIPLVGTHFALAGQADIWLSCYAGLGIIALLRGLLDATRWQSLLGVLFCLIGVTIKIEGFLWLLLGLLLLATNRNPAWGLRAALGLFIVLLAFTTLAPDALWANAVGSLLGPLAAPVAGGGGAPEVADDYLQNYLLGGSWHLAGWLTLVAVPLLLLHARRGQRYASLALTLIALQASVLLLIFSYSTHSAWAEDWTAINRLPLQLIPVHCFIWALIATGLGDLMGTTRRQPLFIVAASGAALVALVTGALQVGESAPERRFPADTLRAVIGSGELRDGRLELSEFRGNLALASSGPVNVNLAERPLVEVVTGGVNRRSASFFWRPSDAPENLQSVALPVRGHTLIDLREIAETTESISEFGVLAYRDTQGNPLEVGDIRFLTDAPATLLRKLWLDWRQPAFWTQKSAHWIPAGHADPLLPLPLAVIGLALLGALSSLLILRRTPGQALGPAACALALAWLLLDARWLVNRLAQAQRTVEAYPFLHAETHDFSNDGLILEAIKVAGEPAAEASPLLISAERADMRYEMLRAKYHVAPRPALVLETLDGRSMVAGDSLLLLRSVYGGARDPDRSIGNFHDLAEGSGMRLRIVRNSSGATLAAVESGAP